MAGGEGSHAASASDVQGEAPRLRATVSRMIAAGSVDQRKGVLPSVAVGGVGRLVESAGEPAFGEEVTAIC